MVRTSTRKGRDKTRRVEYTLTDVQSRRNSGEEYRADNTGVGGSNPPASTLIEGEMRKATENTQSLKCSKHGETIHAFRKKENRYRCRKCSVDNNNRRRKKVKQILVQEAGGLCVDCGLKFPIYVFDFDHRNPEEKSFTIAHNAHVISLEKMREEAAKCDLVCANCHRVRTHKQRCKGCEECS